MADLVSVLPQAAKEWVLAVPLDERARFLAAFSGAARAVGKADVSVPERGVWGADEVARAALLVRAGDLVSPEDVFARGDNRERQAVLKALPFLENPARFLALAVEACRTNVLTVFSAIACDNPYPALHFPEPSFNQMVLKAAFNGVPFARILGLAARTNSELSRMAADYAAERRAAGRSVPADLALITKGAAS